MPPRRWRKKYPFLYTRRARIFRKIFTYFTTYLILVPLLLWVFLASQSNPFPEQLYEAQRVLIVLAHRSDATLFFSPTILRVTSRPEQDKLTRLLVLSKDDHHGQVDVDNTDFFEACDILGIAERHCNVRDLPGHVDDADVVWSRGRIEATVKSYVMKWAVDAIITFDDGGVTGHENHVSVSDAIVNYVSHTESAPPVYTLTTVNVLRKYSLLADLPLTTLTHALRRLFFSPGAEYTASDTSVLSVNSMSMWRQSVSALEQHENLETWTRYLYALLGRYMWINDLKLVVPGSAKRGQ
ncbi:putative deacetylase LmbE-like domain-containing protein [Exophiala viscosa]|uniref:putative deacetylase LmbE-like domain-containing protein n=1 Tax=Exophiala viscosa TaxID=2486360 RepID=UPI00219F5358|nr:putative deacetylase LmbE-like domain-containing protein [Exophiala viscosa]